MLHVILIEKNIPQSQYFHKNQIIFFMLHFEIQPLIIKHFVSSINNKINFETHPTFGAAKNGKTH